MTVIAALTQTSFNICFGQSYVDSDKYRFKWTSEHFAIRLLHVTTHICSVNSLSRTTVKPILPVIHPLNEKQSLPIDLMKIND